MSAYALPLISLIIGAVLGLFSTTVASNIRHKQDITVKVFDLYLKVREEIVSAVCPLADRTILEALDKEKFKTCRDAIAVMYYKYYDLLPTEILESLVLLNVCLTKLDGSVYKSKEGAIIRMSNEEIIEFIDLCYDHKNGKYMAAMVINGDNQQAKINQAIMLHTRHVLKSLSAFLPAAKFLFSVNSLTQAKSAAVKYSSILQIAKWPFVQR